MTMYETPVACADVGQQVEDLGLDGDVERRHGLVEDDQPRLGRQGPGDRDPLALAARQRPGRRASWRSSRPTRSASSATRARRGAAVGAVTVQPQDLVERAARRLARVEAGVRILEDDLDLAPRGAAARRPIAPGPSGHARRRRSSPPWAWSARRACGRSSSCPSPTRRRWPASRRARRRGRRVDGDHVAVALAQAGGLEDRLAHGVHRPASCPRAARAPAAHLHRRSPSTVSGRAPAGCSAPGRSRSAARTRSPPAPRTPTPAGRGSPPAAGPGPLMRAGPAESAAV